MWNYMSHGLKVKVLWKMEMPDYRHFCYCFCNMNPHGWFGRGVTCMSNDAFVSPSFTCLWCRCVELR